ncbi:hypothetical protein WBJ53_25990 [Spirosoma sp. SC4-14]|uniref:hypothetical protein n=1 Tax=Spirosoma sp. SC4-14 TaxID=3128900 RepID=UPI0030D2F2E4
MSRVVIFLLSFFYARCILIKMASLNTEIKKGDRVSVSVYKGIYFRYKYAGTAVNWTDAGRIRVKADKDGKVKAVNPEHVKKLPL